jgi:hypothetical protein
MPLAALRLGRDGNCTALSCACCARGGRETWRFAQMNHRGLSLANVLVTQAGNCLTVKWLDGARCKARGPRRGLIGVETTALFYGSAASRQFRRTVALGWFGYWQWCRRTEERPPR